MYVLIGDVNALNIGNKWNRIVKRYHNFSYYHMHFFSFKHFSERISPQTTQKNVWLRLISWQEDVKYSLSWRIIPTETGTHGSFMREYDWNTSED